MLHIPVYRQGRFYRSVDRTTLVHHATGQPVAELSLANAGLIARDIARINPHALADLTMRQLLDICRKAAATFIGGKVDVDGTPQSFDDYLHSLSATTGMPLALARANAAKIHRVLDDMASILAGLTRGFDLQILDSGYGQDDGRMLSWQRVARVFGAVLPSNSPGVHSLWMPALALKTPTVVKPGREEPWSPLRIMLSLVAAGLPAEAVGFYPSDHGGAGQLLQSVDRAMLFGDASTTRAWAKDPRVELHGPGYSKVILGPDVADRFEPYLEVIAGSIMANGGRSCINASAVWTPSSADRLAEALGAIMANVKPLPADHPEAQLCAFANPQTARRISQSIDAGLPGADEVTQRLRGSDRLVESGRCAYLLPTLVRCDREHPLANREFLFPYASVVECPADEIPHAVGSTLVATAITDDPAFRRRLLAAGHIDRLNFGPVPTWRLSWDQPHEGNLFEHLYRQRALQVEAVHA